MICWALSISARRDRKSAASVTSPYPETTAVQAAITDSSLPRVGRLYVMDLPPKPQPRYWLVSIPNLWTGGWDGAIEFHAPILRMSLLRFKRQRIRN